MPSKIRLKISHRKPKKKTQPVTAGDKQRVPPPKKKRK